MNKIVETRYVLKVSEMKEILNQHFSVSKEAISEFRVWSNCEFQFSVIGDAEHHRPEEAKA